MATASIASLPDRNQHAAVLQHGRKRSELAAALLEARGEHERLVDSRASLRRQAVDRLLGSGGGQPADTATLSKLETSIRAVSDRIVALEAALAICDERLAGAYVEADAERREQAQVLARNIAAKMRPVFDQLLVLNAELLAASDARGGYDEHCVPADPTIMAAFRRQLGD